MSRDVKYVMIVKGIKSELPLEEMERRYKVRMPDFRELPGLVQKYYSYDESSGEWAGIYLWDSRAALDAYLASDLRKSIATAYQAIRPPQLEILPVADVLRA
jgi:hypothetical protein